MKKILLTLTLLPLILIGCYKNVDNTTSPTTHLQIPEVYIDTKISGTVFDISGNILSDYSIIVNDEKYSISGSNFLLSLEDVKKKGQTIFVEKNGVQIGVKTMLLVENDINKMNIGVHAPWEINTSHTKELLFNFGEIDFIIPSNNFSSLNAQAYFGEITINSGLIDISNDITNVAYASNLDLLVVKPKGGFYIDFLDDNNNPLTFNESITCHVNQLPDNTKSIVHLDQEKEQWIKIDLKDDDSFELKEGGYYLYVDYNSGIFASGKVNYEGNPISYQTINFGNQKYNLQCSSTLNGNWHSIVPENENSIEVDFVNLCNEIVQNSTFETKKIDIENKSFQLDNQYYSQLNLEVVSCSGSTVNDPILLLNNQVYQFAGNSINSWISSCENIFIGTEGDGQVGPIIPWNKNTSSTVQFLTSCNDLLDGYSFIKIDNVEKIYPPFNLSKQGNNSVFRSEDNTIKLIVKGQSIGMYEEEDVNIYINDVGYGSIGYFINCDESTLGCGITECNISEYNENGWTILGLSGEIWIKEISTNEAKLVPFEGNLLLNK